MKQIILIIMSAMLWISCQDEKYTKSARFIITNNTDLTADSIYFLPGDPAERKYLRLLPGEKKNYEVSLEGVETDGAYQINYVIGKERKSQTFGYFSNGLSLEKSTEIRIEKDSLLIHP